MTIKTLENRLALLEAELADVKKRLPAKPRLEDAAWGVFAGDPIFLEAMELGREYRESLRPKSKAKSKTKTIRSRDDARARH